MDSTMKEMTSRERVLCALSHQQPDRQPVDYGGTVVTCIDAVAHERLLRHLAIGEDRGPIIDYTMGTVVPNEKIQRLVGSDVRRVGMNVIPPNIVDDRYRDGFGMLLRRAVPHLYYDIIEHPLANAESVEDLIDVGVDIFNPVQTTATDMNVEMLKSRFGDWVCFWGGIDEQTILRASTQEQVRQEVRHVATTLGRGGGYVLAAAHNIQVDVPPVNLLAMYDEARRICF